MNDSIICAQCHPARDYRRQRSACVPRRLSETVARLEALKPGAAATASISVPDLDASRSAPRLGSRWAGTARPKIRPMLPLPTAFLLHAPMDIWLACGGHFMQLRVSCDSTGDTAYSFAVNYPKSLEICPIRRSEEAGRAVANSPRIERQSSSGPDSNGFAGPLPSADREVPAVQRKAVTTRRRAGIAYHSHQFPLAHSSSSCTSQVIVGHIESRPPRAAKIAHRTEVQASFWGSPFKCPHWTGPPSQAFC